MGEDQTLAACSARERAHGYVEESKSRRVEEEQESKVWRSETPSRSGARRRRATKVKRGEQILTTQPMTVDTMASISGDKSAYFVNIFSPSTLRLFDSST